MQLVIVRRKQFAAFDRLSQAFGDEADVSLIWDRRGQDRRQHSDSRGGQKRRGQDRRLDPSAGWGDLDYVITQGTGGVPIEDRRQAVMSADASAAQMSALDARKDLEAAVRSDLNVLITRGDPVSRKSLARRIHARSDRHDRPFVVLDRPAAAELFGKLCECVGSKGEQTGAWPSHLAHGGTLLIEEVVDLSREQQSELLFYLERRAARADGTETGGANAPRVIAASRHWLLDRIASTEFRPDLFYRLNLIHVVLPLGTVRAPLAT
jgi:transcriptional regulator of acetoin/glycerol metabolism